MKFLSNKKNLYFTGIYLSLFAFMICSATGEGEGIILFKVLAVLLFGLFLFGGNSADGKADFEKSVMVIAVLLFNIFMIQRGKMQGYSEVFNIICSALLIIMGIAYFVFCHEGISVRKWFSENKLILLVITCFVLLSVEVIDAWSMWDSYIYHNSQIGVAKNFNADLSGIYGLYLSGHPSIGYSIWAVLFQLLKEGAASVQIADIVLAGISIFAYYQILRKLLGKKHSDKILALATMPYAFSPFLMGIIGNVNPDSATMYFVMIFIACSLYHYECLELIFAFLLCFTKETAVIYYVVYIIAKVICEYLAENQFHLIKLAKFGFGNFKNYLYALPAVLWIFLFKMKPGGAWQGVSNGTDQKWNYFGFDEFVIQLKLKQVFFLNFNWIFWLIIVLGIIILCIKKVKIEKEIITILLPIFIMAVSVIAFGCIYVTFVLARYIVLIMPTIYLIVTCLIGRLKEKHLCVWSILISALLFLQCFQTVDPVMHRVFPSMSIGEDQELCMVRDEEALDDSIVYNRQYMYWSEVLEEILERSGYNGDMLIVYPSSYLFSKHHIMGAWNCAWNVRTRELAYYREDAIFSGECKEVVACGTGADILRNLDAVNSNYILYIIPYCASVNENFTSGKSIIKQGEVEHKGYHVTYMVMKVELPLDDDSYTVSPKQDNTKGLCTDGYNLLLKEDAESIDLSAAGARYKFKFHDYKVVMDVQYNQVNDFGTVWVYEDNGTNAQRWDLEKVDSYYMICWGDYALTYDLDNNSVRLTPKNGSDNQLWSFN